MGCPWIRINLLDNSFWFKISSAHVGLFWEKNETSIQAFVCETLKYFQGLNLCSDYKSFFSLIEFYLTFLHKKYKPPTAGRNPSPGKLRQWVRLESAYVENPCIGLSDGEFKIFKIPKP